MAEEATARHAPDAAPPAYGRPAAQELARPTDGCPAADQLPPHTHGRPATEELADRQVWQKAIDDGLVGPDYERLMNDLAGYGFRVCQAWLATGMMFRECAARGRPIGAPPPGLTPDDRTELALETVAYAVRDFKAFALELSEWDPRKGSLTTYFIGSCINAFPNVFRRWQREEASWRPITRGDGHEDMTSLPDATPGPEVQVIGQMELKRRLAAMGVRTAVALVLISEGFSYAEIGEILDVTGRAVEALVYRHRREILKRGKGDVA
ncbi:RNA polymerase sigma factor [Actinoplanes sp. NPDC020271]|uniref:RNA polymerase sigma factor n=1 Tax=Actinoplanes sp. NPDC020271 TaxID=3363896 RepID=UPI00379D47CD